MRILNFNRDMTHLNGQTVYEPGTETAVTINRVLANILSGITKGIEPAKAMDWAYKLYNDGIIKVDRSDFNKIKELISKNELLSNLQTVQLLNVFEDFTEESDAKEETTEEGSQEDYEKEF